MNIEKLLLAILLSLIVLLVAFMIGVLIVVCVAYFISIGQYSGLIGIISVLILLISVLIGSNSFVNVLTIVFYTVSSSSFLINFLYFTIYAPNQPAKAVIAATARETNILLSTSSIINIPLSWNCSYTLCKREEFD